MSFAEDEDGRIWIGSNAFGLSVYEEGRFRSLGSSSGLPTGHVSALLVDSRNGLWIGTADRGLFRRRRDGRLEPFGPAQGLPDKLVALMVEDAGGNLWVSTTRGIARLDRARIEAVAGGRARTLEPILIDRSDGLRHLEGSGGGFDPSGLRTKDGRLWFSTLDGFASIDPATFAINERPPPVLIEGADVGGRPARRDAGGAYHIPAGTEAIEIPYTAFSLLAPARVRFKYRLAEYDSTWHEAGSRRTAYYSRLPPGTYTFEVLAANNDNVWSPTPAAARLVVAPFWWERRGVQALATGLLMVVVGMAVRAAVLRRARRRLAALEREQALARERSRIARDLHDDLGSRLAHIALLADAAAGGSGRERLSHAAREAVQTIDELVWAVSARNDTVESFANYTAQFAQEHLQAAGLRCRLRIQPDLGSRELAADTRRHLYLAFKEAVTNAVKHARASEVRVTIAMEDRTLVVEVRDNGRGFALADADSTGTGLQNMQERMTAAGGTVAIDSAPGQGTGVVLKVSCDGKF